jgi:hypothetical protein
MRVVRYWSQIGGNNSDQTAFKGNFNGNGKVIRNLAYSVTSITAGGLFGIISNAIIENLGLENCNIVGYAALGGLVGYAKSSTISNCYVTGSVKGSRYTGGLVGYAPYCTYISNCYFSGNVSAVGNGLTRGVGGLVGFYGGICSGEGLYRSIISNCYVTGKVSAISITPNSYMVGGLIGHLSDGIIRNCIVALDSITSTNITNPYINRIAGAAYFGYPPVQGSIGAILEHNYALNSMVVQDGNGNVPIFPNLNTEAGMDIPLDSLKSFTFYNRTANWSQTAWNIQNPSGVWKICDGIDLPFLRWQGIVCNYDITATAGINGSISPSGITNIDDTASQTFTFAGNACYTIDSLFINGVYSPDSISVGSYTFKNIIENSSIKVSFKRLPADTVIIKDTIYCGASYSQNGFNISNAITDSVYFNNDFNTNGCDSVTRLELMVNSLILTPINDSICVGNSYNFNGKLLTAKGIYYDSLQTISGCDSVIELILTVNPTYFIQISDSFCVGDSYNFNGKLLTAKGIYYDSLQTIFGCDSIIELTLTISNVGIVETQLIASLPRIYPNPTDGTLHVTGYELRENSTIEIFDIYGRKVSASPNPSKGGEQVANGAGINLHSVSSPPSEGLGEVVIDISHLAKGMYFLTVDGKVFKVVKE